MAVRCPKGFELKTEPYWVDKPVFDEVTSPDEAAVTAINRSLGQISAFVRLYYHLISVYRKYISESPAFKGKVYQIEYFRREIQAKIDKKSNKERLGNELYLQLLSDAHTILYRGDGIIQTYQDTRDVCLRESMPSKFMRLRMICDVIEMEKKLFAEYPETKYAYEKTAEDYLRAVFGTTIISFTQEEIITQFRDAVTDSFPSTHSSQT